MKSIGGIWLISLIVGMSLSMAVSSKPVMAVSNDPYQAFWEILNREAELVVQFNETGNASLAVELIQNSFLGAENAANISALIWQSLDELKTSGIKTYYTAQELREMAQNISQNGLPEETVQALKSQGWTDEQIQALEDYIAQNADNINEDFNMTAFLEDFSLAFIDVAFKYNHYESWTLEKWKWSQPAEPPQATNNEMVNPILAKEWVEFYRAYLSGDYNNMKSKVYRLKGSMYKLLSNEKRNCTLTFLRDGNLVTQRGIIKGINHTTNGSLVFTTLVTSSKGKYIIWNVTTYYWPDALYAYELSSNILALVTAIESGNENDELVSILNQKVAELKDTMKVLIIENKVLKNPIRDDPIRPIEPIYPINPKLPAQPVSSLHTSGDGSVETNHIPTEILNEALNTEDNTGQLKITEVKVIVDKNLPGKVEYHVKVLFKAENNAVNNIRIDVEDRTTGDSDSGTLSFLNSGESYIWNSKKFTLTHNMEGELIVSGKVEITYTPSCGDVPLSKNHETLSTSPNCQERTITREYSSTINLESPVDWNKVRIRIEASKESVTAGESVTYRVVVENGNSVPLDDVEYSISIPFSPTNSRTYSDTVNVPANGEKTLLEQTVTYEDASTYVAHASIYWNGHSKTTSKSVTVTSGTLTITCVDISPATPTHGDTVSFDVSVRNPISRSRIVTVKLFIDGVEKSSKTITIGGGSSKEVTLTWAARAGEHDWRIEAWEDGKLEDSRSGTIRVISESDPCPEGEYWTAWLGVSPTEMVGEGKVHVKVMASYCSALPDVGGDTIDLLYLGGSVYLDGREIHSFDTNANGNYLLVGKTRVIDEFDWPVSVGNHNITLKIKNTGGLLDYIKTKTDSVSVRGLPLEYPLELTEISCGNLNFNFEASNYYTQGNYVSPLECTLKFRNIESARIYVKELSTEISVSPPNLEEVIQDHIAVPVNENVNPGEIIPIQIRGKALTTDRQMLLRVDRTTATLYLDYTIDGIINGVSKIVAKGVTQSTIGINVDTKTVWADYGYDTVTIFISFVKITKATKIAKITKTAGKLGGVLTFLDKFVNDIPNIPKNIVLEIISNV
ncbi:COG1470 family protein [Thermococcus barossii]|uniref:DUF11 domain-containing protein n=1 Tax=Thermococcus barossii TaxID=54077 RepID=A0A2Z2MI84_9EURY|nr:hypothetical protein [Thermococcus barossii]ASJ05616.1 hypothetical protein A3L01_09665 [Thermococcus barossii]